jgi:hypothetical protein
MIGRRTIWGLAATAVGLAMLVSAAAAQDKPRPWNPPKTPWGDPDLRGTWPLDTLGRTPLQRPAQFGERAALTDEEYDKALKAAAVTAGAAEREEKDNRLGNGHWLESGKPLRQTSLIVEPANGRLPPLTANGQQLAAVMKSSWTEKAFDSPADFNSLDRCITRGLVSSMTPFPYNNGVRIFQSPGYVVMQLEMVHETRIIPLDGRPPLPGAMRTWLGDSHGHFEGKTLVIETGAFNGQSPMTVVSSRANSIPTSPSMHVVERLTPTGPDSIQYEARVEDPDILTQPWRMSFPWTRNDHYRFFEYACHEGNSAIANYIRATSPRFAQERGRNGGIVEGLSKATELKR